MAVDDNRRDLRTIQEMVDWDALNARLCAIASDGKQALEIIEHEPPDIVLSDIAMPRLDGIALARRLNADFPRIQILFMSAYDDFAYAHSAIELSISDYLLKPLSREALEDALMKAIAACEAMRFQEAEKVRLSRLTESIPVLAEDFYRGLVFGRYSSVDEISARAEFLGINILEYRRFILLASESSYADESARRALGDFEIKQLLGEAERCQAVALQSERGRFLTLLLMSDDDDNAAMDTALDYAANASDRAMNLFGAHLMFGVSDCTADPLALPRLVEQTDAALSSKFCSNGSPIILFSEIAERTSTHESLDVGELFKRIQDQVLMGSSLDILAFTDSLYANPADNSEEYLKSLTFTVVNLLQVLLMERGLDFSSIFGRADLIWRKLIQFETIIDLRQWMYNVFAAVKETIQDKSRERDTMLVHRVKDLIRERYAEQLTVQSIADAVYLSPKQANFIFKRETGLTIFDYLVAVRMDAAKRMLKETGVKVTSIIRDVGYMNNSHFTIMFKKTVGMTPTEYRRKPVI